MKLHAVRVREFKSVWDSNTFEVDRITCLVGKNEAGKTAILQALDRLNPMVGKVDSFDVTDDYPRSAVEDYKLDVESNRREQAVVVEATYKLEAAELTAIREEYGEGALVRDEVVVSKGYKRDASGNTTQFVDVPVNEAALVKNLVAEFSLPDAISGEATQKDSLAALSQFLSKTAERHEKAVADALTAANQIKDAAEKAAAIEANKTLAESVSAKALRARLTELLAHKALGVHIWESHLRKHFPRFFYFDEYYQMEGHANVEALKQRKASNTLKDPDRPLLGLIELARLDLDKLLAPDRTQALKNMLQGASNHLSSKILQYWSQNRHLQMHFDVRPGLKGDPDGMRSGTNIWAEVFDSKHRVSTPLGTRSAGFVWFFSFLAWYSAEKKKNEPLVLLLDEPGLSLHGKAQEDLLRYFEAEIAPNPKHQLIYTTHSPFMVDPQHFERVRIVQDKGIDSDKPLPREEDGTKIFTDVLEAGPDSLFPLQAALGYEVYQTLFIGPNSLVVEGVSDLLYLQTMSGILQAKGRTGLDSRWTITPVGGADKVPTFVALIGSQKNLNVATLIDFQKKDQQMIENLYKKKLLEKSRVLTFADFTGKKEADIEDMFDESFYVQLVNKEFADSLSAELKVTSLPNVSPRILVRIEDFLQTNPLKAGATFNHYRPARFFAEKTANLSVPDAALEKFEAAFKAVNRLLPS